MESSEKGSVVEQLLPGIPDDVTLTHIVTKLPWIACQVLSSVCRRWNEEVKSREVYNSRLRSHATETLVIVNLVCATCHCGDKNNTICLYSPKERAFYRLPPIAHLKSGIPWSSRFISLNGKIYVIGGGERKEQRSNNGGMINSQDVYELDIFGQGQWKKITSMREQRYIHATGGNEGAYQRFGCAVLQEKIYVFGGWNSNGNVADGAPLPRSEVYHPKENAWSSLKAIPFQIFSYLESTLGDEIFVQHRSADGTFQVYHPMTDEWRMKETWGVPLHNEILFGTLPPVRRIPFVVQGKLYWYSNIGMLQHSHRIEVYDVGTNRWTLQHFVLWKGHKSLSYYPIQIVSFNNELLGIFRWEPLDDGEYKQCLLQTKGFGGQSVDIFWQETPQPCGFGGEPSAMCLIEL